MVQQQYFYGTGRRKTSVARVRLYPGTGTVIVNGRPFEEVFPRELHQMQVLSPLRATGNQGKLWNELDLVPFRTTIDGGGTNEFVIAVDREDAGHPGYDVLSAPVINEALSDDSCQVYSSGELIQSPGQGGADKTLYRVKKGNYMGQNFGLITDVTESDIKLKEIVQDSAGDWAERQSVLPLLEETGKGDKK